METCAGELFVHGRGIIAGSAADRENHVEVVIDRRYPLSVTAEALRYLEERHARGKIVLTVGHRKGT